ncbi:hypothetical protein ACFPU0_11730 [Pseudomonas sp. GCM10022186]|uniref:hypothetical protein n=1 Tax=Pseudomonas sp. GCM10022186 TaxID=3252650 RepID=UPI003618DDCF
MRFAFYKNGAYPYESVAGILWGIRKINYLSTYDFAREIGKSSFRYEAFLTRIPRDLSVLPGCKYHQVELHYPSSYCPDFLLVMPRRELKFCERCSEIGYHSVFWMLKGVNKCHIHNLELMHACSKCVYEFTEGCKAGKCNSCGFEIIEPRAQLAFRNDKMLNYEIYRSGKIISNWYSGIYRRALSGSGVCKDYFRLEKISGPSNELTYSLEKLLGVKSPRDTFSSNICSYRGSWIDIGSIDSGQAYGFDDYHVWRNELALFFIEIENQYLGRHKECFSEVDSLLAYSDGIDRRCALCPLALAYSLLRLGAACEWWPTPTSVSPSKSCFDFFMRHASFCNMPITAQGRLIRILFLGLLGEIQLALDLGESKEIQMRGTNIIDRFTRGGNLVFVRRSSFWGRVNCLYPLEIDANRHLIRDGKTGRLRLEIDN